MTVWTAATSDPTRELMTPVARNSWNVSAGMRNWSSRNGTAALRLPKKLRSPVSASCGYCETRHQRVGEPSREQHEAQGEQLPGVREVEGGRHDDVRQPARLAVVGIEPVEQRAARLDEGRQHDEEVAGDEGDHERALRLAEDVSGSNRRERADQSRQHPQAHQQRHRDVRREIDLQAAQLLQAHRPGRVRRNRKQSVGRQAIHEPGGARDRVFRDLQDVEQTLLAFDADQPDAQHDGEQDDGGHDVVRQRIERIRGNVEVDEVERRPPLDEARAEERRVLHRGKRQRDQERERERHEPQAADDGRGPQAQRADLRVIERPEAGDDGDGDVRQHHHLKQPDETVGRPLQCRRLLAEKEAGDDASDEPDEDLS